MTRERLPDRRPAIGLSFEHRYPGADPRVFSATVGFYDAACTRPAEVFINSVNGTEKQVTVDHHDAAVALSIALQHGASLDEMGQAMLHGNDGAAHGFLGSLAQAVMLAVKGEVAA